MIKPACLISFRAFKPGLAIALMCMCVLGCRTKETVPSAEVSKLSMLLVDSVSGEAIPPLFPAYKMASPRRISRTENRWSMQWQVAAKDKKDALAKLQEHSWIISISEMPDTIHSPSNSTNTGHSKTKPIKNQ